MIIIIYAFVKELLYRYVVSQRYASLYSNMFDTIRNIFFEILRAHSWLG